MNKKDFIKIVKELVALKKIEYCLNEAFRKFDSNFNYICFGRYEELVVKMLELAMNDTSEWISYWLYECDCGKYSKNKVKDKKGKNIPLKTISDLYNCITKK